MLMSTVEIPRETVYSLKKENLKDIKDVLQNLPLILYLNEDHSKFIMIISQTSTPYVMFNYGTTSQTIGPYKCLGVSHINSASDPDFCNLENGSYFDWYTLQKLIDRTTKCVIHKTYANRNSVTMCENLFDKEEGKIDWSTIVTRLAEKGLIKSKMSERDDVGDGRKIREVNGKDVRITVDTLYDLGERETESSKMLLDLYRETYKDSDNSNGNYCVIS